LSKFKTSVVVGCWFGASGWFAWWYKVVYFILGVLIVLWLLYLKLYVRCWYI